MKTHPCAIPDCEARVKTKMLMCPKHWRMVPPQIKRAVWEYYRAGQDISTASEEYMDALHAATGAVQQKEGN